MTHGDLLGLRASARRAVARAGTLYPPSNSRQGGRSTPPGLFTRRLDVTDARRVQSADSAPRYVNLAVKAKRGPRVYNARVDANKLYRTAEIDLVPNVERRHRLVCPKGHKGTWPRHGVGWYTPKPPKESLRSRVTDTPKILLGGRGMEVHVVTGKIPRNTVRLQISVDCVKGA
jgi:hypothetical protein